MSLDGYVADESGRFGWAVPDEVVHAHINELERPIATHLYGRTLHEVMVAWETVSANSDLPAYVLDFAKIWQAADKIVYSKSLNRVSSSRTRIEHDFDAEKIRKMKETTAGDMSVGGSDLAAQAIRAGLVDEYHFFITPDLIGGGQQLFPKNVRLNLKLLDECRFDNGMVHIRYSTGN